MSTFFNRCVTLLSASLVFAASAFAATAPSVLVRPQARVTDKIDNKQLSVLCNTTPAVVASAADQGRLASSTPLNHMLLVLKSSDEQDYALRSLIDQQQDKTNRNYHKWMTPEAFNAAFGVASSDIPAVSNWLKDSGFAVEKIAAGGRVVEFSSTSGQVESALHTELQNVTVDGETHFTNTVDLSVPAALSPVVVGISQLNNFDLKANAVNPHPFVKGKDGHVSRDRSELQRLLVGFGIPCAAARYLRCHRKLPGRQLVQPVERCSNLPHREGDRHSHATCGKC